MLNISNYFIHDNYFFINSYHIRHFKEDFILTNNYFFEEL